MILVYSIPCVKRPLKKYKTKILMTNGSLMKVESIQQFFWPALSDDSSWNQFPVFLRVAVLHRFYYLPRQMTNVIFMLLILAFGSRPDGESRLLCLSVIYGKVLTLYAPISTNVVCFSRLLKCLRSLYGKQCGPRSDCSYRSSLFSVHAICFYIKFVSYVRKLFAADDFSRRHFQVHFFLGALRVKLNL